MLELQNVSKIYQIGTFGGKQLHAVREASFRIGEGEVVSLIGESGSGKSTIGKMILRLISITSGAIRFKGQDVASLKGKALKEYYANVQGVFQDPFSSYNPIFKADRVFELVRQEFFQRVSHEEWKARVRKSVQAVGLNPDQCLHKYPHQLSGGQLQRLLIARALLMDVQFLVADEIISMLDASTRVDVLNLLADLKERGLSILFITHDLSLGYYISERALILYRGCIVEMGDTDKLYNNPLHPYTRMLMASVPRIDRKWQDDEESAHVALGGKQVQVDNGCVYYDRCPLADDALGCRQRQPQLVEVERGHFVACYAAPQATNGAGTEHIFLAQHAPLES
ncbi:MAG TPA: ABC transporter ATP-binding protein [Candidatus Sulfomarinibacteraceae bacterium]|nr:ABC transporter ATP-binding protein [Candidatus Sulfomarinibacteraceae bacterium]